jgi:hypothetical protein
MRRTRREVVQSFLEYAKTRDVHLCDREGGYLLPLHDPGPLVDQWLADTGPGRPAGDTVARVVALAAEGQTDEEIARALGVTPGTARAYRSLGKRRERAGRPREETK